jgi:hypothetical protein
VLDAPGIPKYPLKHEPQVLATELQLFLKRFSHKGTPLQFTEFKAAVVAVRINVTVSIFPDFIAESTDDEKNSDKSVEDEFKGVTWISVSSMEESPYMSLATATQEIMKLKEDNPCPIRDEMLGSSFSGLIVTKLDESWV